MDFIGTPFTFTVLTPCKARHRSDSADRARFRGILKFDTLRPPPASSARPYQAAISCSQFRVRWQSGVPQAHALNLYREIVDAHTAASSRIFLCRSYSEIGRAHV